MSAICSVDAPTCARPGADTARTRSVILHCLEKARRFQSARDVGTH
jgi:hypothetical protein